LRLIGVLALIVLLESPALAQRALPYDIPNPSALTYTMISARRVASGRIEVVVHAKGKISGELYVRKLFDCTLPRLQELGQASTLEGLTTSRGSPGQWLPVTPGGTDAAVYRAACQELILLEP
jgi:hypothetical protein